MVNEPTTKGGRFCYQIFENNLSCCDDLSVVYSAEHLSKQRKLQVLFLEQAVRLTLRKLSSPSTFELFFSSPMESR
jgi:hypothetical protein